MNTVLNGNDVSVLNKGTTMAHMTSTTYPAGERFRPLTPADRREIEKLDDCIALLLSRGIQSLMHARTFLAVIREPGQGSAVYAKRLGGLQPVVSRHLLELGVKSRNGGPGMGFVDRDSDPADLRNHRNFLTPAGRGLAQQLVSILHQR